MMNKKIVFDLDGVIVDTEGQWRKMWMDFLNSHGYVFTEDDYVGFAGGNWPIYFKLLSNKYPEFYPDCDTMMKDYYAHFKDYKIDFTKLAMPYVREVVIELKKRGYTIAIASSSPSRHIHEVLEMLEISSCFDFYVSGYDFKKSKPDPEIYLFTADKLKEKPQDLWVVEDSTYGIAAAVAAGMKVIALKDERFDYDQSKADYLVDDLRGILEVVE